MASLQDQLLKAGVVDQKKVKQIKKEQHKQAKQQPKGKPLVDENKESARQALEERSARDREINRLNQAEVERKALRAQIIQLVNLNRIDRGQGDVAYNFTDENKIKKINVSEKLHYQLGAGMVAIVRLDSGYELVPAGVADKIRQRDDSVVIVHNTRTVTEIEEDDPYADFQIPDDLMW